MDEFKLPHPEQEKRPVLAFIGLILSILNWIAVFAFPKTDSTEALYTQMYILIGSSLVAGLLCWLGRKQAFGMAMLGIVVALFLLITLGCSLIGMAIG
ncbi:MAG: hypothetical protein J6R27_05705 [Muribaculaceae bacterium]|nr:hypothetical protein [Muribaculaceae bacterium]